MAARKRDYAKEYAQRTEKAQREGYRSYGEKRRINARAVERFMSLSPKSNRKTAAYNVSRMKPSKVRDLLSMSDRQIRQEAKSNSLYHYK